MDDSEREQRQCGHKIMYFSVEQARKAAKAMHKRVKAQFRVYSCPFCDNYHIGTVRSREQAQRRAERRTA